MPDQASTTPRTRTNRRSNREAGPVTLTLTADSTYVPWDVDGKKHNTLKFAIASDSSLTTDGNSLFEDDNTDATLFKGNVYPSKAALRAGMIAAGIATMPKSAHIAVTFTF